MLFAGKLARVQSFTETEREGGGCSDICEVSVVGLSVIKGAGGDSNVNQRSPSQG